MKNIRSNRSSWSFVALAVLLVSSLSAQVAPVVVVPSAPDIPSVLTTITTSSGFWTAIVTLASVIFGILKNKEADTKSKVAQSLVKVIEAASEIPEVKALAVNGIGRLKAAATAEATALGVQDDLHKIVSNITPQG